MTNKPKIYIAGPYTQGVPISNVRAALVVADERLVLGYAPFVPHLSHFWNLILPHTYETWMELDLQWVVMCDVVYRMPGVSVGADSEVDFAMANGIPVLYTMPSAETFYNKYKEEQKELDKSYESYIESD